MGLVAALTALALLATTNGAAAVGSTNNCSAPCSGRIRSEVCDRVCDAVGAMSSEPCGQALLEASSERLDLLSYSSGHVAETLSILLDANGGGGKGRVSEFIKTTRLQDVGSPTGCRAIEDAHYCLTLADMFSIGLCLPRSCDSAAVTRLVGNITAVGIFPDDNSNINHNNTQPASEESSGDDDSGDDDGSFFVVCEDERTVYVDAVTIAVFSLVSALFALNIAGTALEHRRRRREATTRIKRGKARTHGTRRLAPGASDFGRGGVVDHGNQPSATESSRGTLGGAEAGEAEELLVDQIGSSDGHLQESEGWHGDRSGDDNVREHLLVPVTSARAPPVSSLDLRSTPSTGDAGLDNGRHDEVPRWHEFLECFSLLTNVDKLLAPPRARNEFSALEGVRVLSMLWVVMGHTFEAMLFSGVGATNVMDVLPVKGHGLLARLSAQVLIGSFLAVDSFFLLSGFLLSATLLPKLEHPERPLTPRAWRSKVYLHRYVRLTPTLAFVTAMTWKVLPLIGQGQGPLWWDFARDIKESCQENWWVEILYLTNFAGGCVDGTWYLSNDMQLFLASVPLVALYHRSPRKAVKVALATLVLSCSLTLSLAFAGDIRLSVFSGGIFDGIVYALPFTRCPVYIIGLLCGFAWHSDFREPHARSKGEECRSVQNKHNFLGRHRAAVPVTTAVSAVLLLLPVYGTYWAYQDMEEFPLPAWLDYMYVAFARPAWAVGVALMCLLCFCGHGGVVNWLLTRPVFATLSRLSYCVYFTHLFMLPWLYWSRDRPSTFTPLDASYAYMGMVLGGFAAAAVLHLLVEAPFRNLEAWATRLRGDCRKRS